MKKTGQILKDSREKKNLSLHEIGMSLKINPKTLQAMEEGDLQKLPAKSFLRGFVKSYAAYLKLDLNEVLSVFQQEMEPAPAAPTSNLTEVKVDIPIAQKIEEKPVAINKTAQSISMKSMPSADQSSDSFFSNKLLLSGGAAILVIFIVLTAKLVEKYQRERVVDQTQIQQIQAEMHPAVDTPPTPPTAVLEDKPLVDTPVEVLKTAEVITEENKSTIQKKEEAKKLEAKIEIKPEIKTEVTAEIKPDLKSDLKAETIVAGKPTEVIVEALNNVVIKYNLGDGKVNSIELIPEQFHTFKSKTLVELDISDGGSVSLIVNGRERGVPGSSGKALRLTYPKQ